MVINPTEEQIAALKAAAAYAKQKAEWALLKDAHEAAHEKTNQDSLCLVVTVGDNRATPKLS